MRKGWQAAPSPPFFEPMCNNEHVQRSFRHKTIIQALRAGQEISVAGFSQLTGASSATIRRDLTELQEQGFLTRTHGGARRFQQRGVPMPFTARLEEEVQAKQAIGQLVANLVQDGDSIIIDNGTTALAAARHLAGRDITALALSLHTAGALAEVPGVKVLIPSGTVQEGSLNITSPSLLEFIADFQVDIFLMGACAISAEHGLTASTYEDALLKRACIKSSQKVVLLSGKEKFGRVSTHAVGSLDAIHALVTTDTVDPLDLTELSKQGIEVLKT